MKITNFFKGLKKSADFFNSYPDDYCFIGRRKLKDLEHEISNLKHEIKDLENKIKNSGHIRTLYKRGHGYFHIGDFKSYREADKAIRDFKKQK